MGGGETAPARAAARSTQPTESLLWPRTGRAERRRPFPGGGGWGGGRAGRQEDDPRLGSRLYIDDRDATLAEDWPADAEPALDQAAATSLEATPAA